MFAPFFVPDAVPGGIVCQTGFFHIINILAVFALTEYFQRLIPDNFAEIMTESPFGGIIFENDVVRHMIRIVTLENVLLKNFAHDILNQFFVLVRREKKIIAAEQNQRLVRFIEFLP